jgi:hypothetical protein
MPPDSPPTPSGTTSTDSNMLNEKLKRMKKKGMPTSLDEVRAMAKAKGYTKAGYSY